MKRIVVCFDGTWNNADNQGGETNVVRIATATRAARGGEVEQSVLYLRGVGTTGLVADKVLSGATGLGIDDNIRSGYMFIAQNYMPGDEIYLFGFSRGAFTARSVVGLMNATGLLKRQSLGKLGTAWTYYRDRSIHGKNPQDFLRSCAGAETHEDASIHFLGVWDTVGALGVPAHLFQSINNDLYGFYDTGACPVMRTACHALAVDEHRDSFVPTLWTGTPPAGTRIEQVWFAGAHADVGGGYVTRGLADIPLVWMARKAEAQGLILDWSCLPDPAKLDPLAPQHDSSSGLFAVDHFLPTYREMCGRAFDVHRFQRLYAPTDREGNVLSTINEGVHRSVLARHAAGQVPLCSKDEDGTCRMVDYRPANLIALLDEAGQPRPGISIVD